MNSPSILKSALRSIWPQDSDVTDRSLIERVREASSAIRQIPDSALTQRAASLCGRVALEGVTTDDDTVVESFALVVEAARRVLQIELYDVQLLGGLALTRGAIAEMQTGEGKTFTAMLPAFTHALAGNGVHVMTVNPYLARRDFESLDPVYRLLGMSVGMIEPGFDPDAKRAAYDCDITYGPGYEFGFDYLRDQVALLSQRKLRLGEAYLRQLRGSGSGPAVHRLQRAHAVAIIDEADSVMLDEATTPLILSAGGDKPATNGHVYLAAMHSAERLECDNHYVFQEAARLLQLTDDGVKRVTHDLGEVPDAQLERPWPLYVEQALRARLLFHRDVHYIVRDNKVLLVDQYTGRVTPDRSWRDGLQQAVQAKEAVAITTETLSVARITRQRYLGLYRHLCGMTGTAQGGERELRSVYGCKIVVIPPHRPCVRESLPTRMFGDRSSKERAIVEEVKRLHQTRRPVLVGTAAIETSHRLADALQNAGVAYQLLNGVQDAEEATVVSGAGQTGAITIATNMAGRGTDIKLGSGVAERGGLHVIATEPQDSSRIDRQLFGRAARQGDPGSCQLFASAEDRLLKRHAAPLARRLVRRSGGEIHKDCSGDIADAQRRAERSAVEHRRNMYRHDDWLETVLNDLVAATR